LVIADADAKGDGAPADQADAAIQEVLTLLR
jgi:hypothetical protein